MANDVLNWKLYGKGVLLFIDFYSGPKLAPIRITELDQANLLKSG